MGTTIESDWENTRLLEELEAARAEIERLENQVQARDAELWGRTQKILQLEQQLAAEQAKNVGLRELVEHFALIDLGRSLLPGDFGLWVLRARKALSTTDDLSALRARQAAIWREAAELCVGDVEESDDDHSDDFDSGWDCGRWNLASEFNGRADAIPAVTLEDLSVTVNSGGTSTPPSDAELSLARLRNQVREECVKLCWYDMTPKQIADAIRATKEQE